MPSIFPSAAWLDDLHQKLNGDAQYAQIARNWEGDLCLVIEADELLESTVIKYLDLWHGKSRSVGYYADGQMPSAAFVIQAPYITWVRILKGELNPIQALATMKLRVKGNMAYIMRNVPTVLDFTRVAQETPYLS